LDVEGHIRERQFHDQWASAIDPRQVPVLETFNASTSPEARWLANSMGGLAGKRVLELGSGAGEGAVYFALQGARVTATDLSPGMVDVIDRVAALHGVTVETKICSAEDLSAFPEASFDVVYAANLLHHANIANCLEQVRRVLKDGGMACFYDPVAHNPLINIYRRMATEVRTEDEHPIRRQDMHLFEERFRKVRKRFFWCTTLLIFVKFYLIDRIHPNQDRYWKRVLVREPELRRTYLALERIDRVLLRLFPFLGWWCWNIAIVVEK
jgi:SAM-dependent methyltransferase